MIGPNAVIQLGEALRARLGQDVAQRIYAAAGCAHLLNAPPTRMIDERVPARLFQQLWQALPAATAHAIAHDAGRRTGRYILENRIPRLARVTLCALPRSIASRFLLSAIQKNAWTFAGSGTCRARFGTPPTIEIAHNPLRMSGGAWHKAGFAELFGALVSSDLEVSYVALPNGSEGPCRFEIRVGAARRK